MTDGRLPDAAVVERALGFVAEFHGDGRAALNCLHSEALAAEVYRLRAEVIASRQLAAAVEKTLRPRYDGFGMKCPACLKSANTVESIEHRNVCIYVLARSGGAA